jgi:predicted amidophosphoribosyltransferase
MKDYAGNKITPKQLAEQILADAIDAKMEFFLECAELDHLTENQKQKTFNQAQKIAQRLAKQLHFRPDSFNWSI